MYAAAVDPGQRYSRCLVELPFSPYAGLVQARRLHAAVSRAQLLRLLVGLQCCCRRHGGIERRIENQIRLLIGPVVADIVECDAQRDAVVEKSEAGTDHELCRTIRLAVQAPGDAHTRRPVGETAQIVLDFITQAGAQGEVRPGAPVVVDEQSGVGLADLGRGVSGIAAELRGSGAGVACPFSSSVCRYCSSV